MISNNNCFAYKPKKERPFCSALNDDSFKEVWSAGHCGSVACPFYKPDRLIKRVGDRFEFYSDETLRIINLLEKIQNNGYDN